MAKARRSDGSKHLRDLRKKAEQRISAHTTDRHAPEEVQRLVHELQVHQAELEMQNEELREAQGQLEASRDRYADLYDFAPVGYVSLDVRGLLLEINLTAAKWLGQERGRLVRHPFANYVVKTDRSAFREYLNRCVGGQKEATCEVGLLTGDAASIPVQLHSVLAQDPETKETLCRTVIMDMTERKQAEEQIQSLARFPSENPEPVLRIARNGEVLYANAAAAALLEALGGGAGQPAPEAYRQAADQAFVSGRRADFEMEHAGRIYAFRTTRPSADAEYINLYGRDITERKQAEETLRQSEEKYRTLVETVQEGIGIVGPDENIVFCNRAYGRLLGYEPEELIGLNLQQFTVPEEFAKYREQTQKRKRGEVSQYETVLYTKAGEAKYFSLSASPLCDDAGTFIGTLGLITDITDRKQAEEQVKAYQRRLRSVGAKLAVAEEQERRRIAAGLHDNVVQALSLAKMKIEDLAGRKPAAQVAPALREVRDLVAQSINDTRTLLFDLSPVTLYELGFEPAVESLLHHIQKVHRLATRFRTDGLPKPMTNDMRVVLFRGVREVLQNVVMHAQARSVSVSVRREDEAVLVEVQDDGVGFDTEKVLSVHEEAGGFGLFDVRERLDYLGGILTIQSEPGKGTTVVLRAPLTPEKACPGRMSHGDSSASG